MKRITFILAGLISLAMISGFMLWQPKVSSIQLSGANVMAFGPDNVLFVGDSKGGKILAIPTEATNTEDPIPYNFLDFDLRLAEVLEMEVREMVIQDMKVHPLSQEVYVAVKKGHAPDAPCSIAIVSPAGNEIRLWDPTAVKSTEVSIKNPASEELVFWRDKAGSTLNITDIDYYDGNLYVAGLQNTEFASTLRKIRYPFNEEQAVVGGIEIYHAIHTQNETRAPIRAMLITELEGEPTLIASYTCTPLVTIPLRDIKEGNKITGNTIAELGYGNTPVDMISYMSQEQDGTTDQKLLVTHKHRSGGLISMKDVASASKGEGLAGKTGFSGVPEGIPIYPLPTSTIIQVDNQNQMMIAALKRNLDTGGLDLVSELKGPYLRLSEFISEYDFPDYKYGEGQEFTKQFHDMIKPLEGYPDLTSDKTEK